MPKVSVIMPVYNTKKEYFREAIESILNQTFTDFELLIIDNGSASYIKKIILSYSDQRIKYFRIKQNEGPAEARNSGLKYAISPYIALIDSDDISYPKRLQRQYDYLEHHPEIGCLGTKAKIIGNLKTDMTFPPPIKHKDIELWLIFKGCVFCHSTMMLRKSILDQYHFQYNSYYVPTEDYALWLDMIGLIKFAVLDECLGEYRFYPENISNKQKKLQYQKGNEAQIKALNKYLNIDQLDENAFGKFMLEKTLNLAELEHINSILPQVIQVLSNKGYPNKDICNLFKNHFRKLFYHVRTISGQWLLLTSHLNSYFGMKFHWRVFCFIFRGLFSIN